jgi:hypothetical protein
VFEPARGEIVLFGREHVTVVLADEKRFSFGAFDTLGVIEAMAQAPQEKSL